MARWWSRWTALLVILLTFVCCSVGGCTQNVTEKDFPYRIEVMSDIHLPVRTEKVKNLDKQQRIIEAKQQVIADINAWKDVRQVVVLGDVVANTGNEEEYAFAAQYFSQFNKPVTFINGNHDYIYEDSLSAEGKRIRANADTRAEKLERFKEKLGITKLFYSQRLGPYLLVFLSIDSLDSSCLAQMSEIQLRWLQQELKSNTNSPTIIFYHAPLPGTLSKYDLNLKEKNSVVQPVEGINEILRNNPQVFLWVSGHTHTAVTNPDFVSAKNRFEDRIINIHNPDMDKEMICTNSLFLYPDKVIIKTFNHKTGNWMDELERTIPVTVGAF